LSMSCAWTVPINDGAAAAATIPMSACLRFMIPSRLFRDYSAKYPGEQAK
jgi:hypothetical protein